MDMKTFMKASPLKQRAMFQTLLDRVEFKPDFDKMTVADLRSIAQERDLLGYGKMKKADLIKALS